MMIVMFIIKFIGVNFYFIGVMSLRLHNQHLLVPPIQGYLDFIRFLLFTIQNFIMNFDLKNYEARHHIFHRHYYHFNLL